MTTCWYFRRNASERLFQRSWQALWNEPVISENTCRPWTEEVYSTPGRNFVLGSPPGSSFLQPRRTPPAPRPRLCGWRSGDSHFGAVIRVQAPHASSCKQNQFSSPIFLWLEIEKHRSFFNAVVTCFWIFVCCHFEDPWPSMSDRKRSNEEGIVFLCAGGMAPFMSLNRPLNLDDDALSFFFVVQHLMDDKMYYNFGGLLLGCIEADFCE